MHKTLAAIGIAAMITSACGTLQETPLNFESEWKAALDGLPMADLKAQNISNAPGPRFRTLVLERKWTDTYEVEELSMRESSDGFTVIESRAASQVTDDGRTFSFNEGSTELYTFSGLLSVAYFNEDGERTRSSGLESISTSGSIFPMSLNRTMVINTTYWDKSSRNTTSKHKGDYLLGVVDQKPASQIVAGIPGNAYKIRKWQQSENLTNPSAKVQEYTTYVWFVEALGWPIKEETLLAGFDTGRGVVGRSYAQLAGPIVASAAAEKSRYNQEMSTALSGPLTATTGLAGTMANPAESAAYGAALAGRSLAPPAGTASTDTTGPYETDNGSFPAGSYNQADDLTESDPARNGQTYTGSGSIKGEPARSEPSTNQPLNRSKHDNAGEYYIQHKGGCICVPVGRQFGDGHNCMVP